MLSRSCKTPTPVFDFSSLLYHFFLLVKPLEQSFSCLLEYSNEREWQSNAEKI